MAVAVAAGLEVVVAAGLEAAVAVEALEEDEVVAEDVDSGVCSVFFSISQPSADVYLS